MISSGHLNVNKERNKERLLEYIVDSVLEMLSSKRINKIAIIFLNLYSLGFSTWLKMNNNKTC